MRPERRSSTGTRAATATAERPGAAGAYEVHSLSIESTEAGVWSPTGAM